MEATKVFDFKLLIAKKRNSMQPKSLPRQSSPAVRYAASSVKESMFGFD